MEVIATAKGYFGAVREVGQKFDVPKGTEGSWFHPTGAEEADEPKQGHKPAKGRRHHSNDDNDEAI
ncbi:MAG: hypothetical protein K0Q92_614 [Steroidobacteraceae bacterium]|jgi:hypothetical protein|nr:hypothetical protein [Steroidobacteraceae bacterium]